MSCPTVFLRAGSNVGAQKRTLNFRSVPLKWVPLSRRADGVNDVGGAHENMGMHSSGLHLYAETGVEDAGGYSSGRKTRHFVELVQGHEEFGYVTGVAKVTCAENCWWSE